jgi:hypothetical protein
MMPTLMGAPDVPPDFGEPDEDDPEQPAETNPRAMITAANFPPRMMLLLSGRQVRRV